MDTKKDTVMVVNVENEIRITGMSKEHKKLIKDSMTLDNPNYYLMINMGKSTYATPKSFKYYREDFDDLIIPRGSRTKLFNFIARHNIPSVSVEKLINTPNTSLKFEPVELREYQRPLVDEIIKGNFKEGVLAMSTGAGKTVISLEIIRRLGLTATILVPNNVILSQFVEDARNLFHVETGVVNGLQKEIKDVTVATYQTLLSRPDLLQELGNRTSILIMDEVQGCVTDKRREVIKGFAPSYIFGLSGTPDRTDKQTRAIFFLSGDIISTHEATNITPTVYVIDTKIEIPLFEEYHAMVEAMVENRDRNYLIAHIVSEEIAYGNKVLCLTKRIKHYENIKSIMGMIGGEQKGVFYIDSKDKTRNETLMKMKRGELDFKAIFGTMSLLSVGFDVPSLDTLIIAGDLKSSVLATQSCGRVLRLFEGKEVATIIDLCDSGNPVFKKQFNNRLRLYNNKGWRVIK